MIIIGADYHPSDQYLALLDTATGEYEERKLDHSAGEAQKFYRELATRGVSVRVGIETTGYTRWFERLLAELGMELWIGDAAVIKTKRVRRQKTDWEDARLLLRLLRENNFPRIWVPSPENRDLRQLLWHRLPLFRAQFDPLLFHRAPRPLEKRTFLLRTNRTFSPYSYTSILSVDLGKVLTYCACHFLGSQ